MMTIILFIFLLSSFVVVAWLLQLWKTRRIRRMIAHLPGPPVVPFFGNALQFMGSNKDIMTTFLRLPTQYSSPFRFFMGNTVAIVTTNPADIQVLCTTSKALSKNVEYDFMKPLIKEGIFTASGPKWKKHRKLIMPTFNQKILNKFVTIFTKQAEILLQQLTKKVGKGSFDAFSFLCPFTVDTICETTMGVEVNAQIEDSPFLTWVHTAVEIASKRMFHIWLRANMIFKLTPYAKQEKCAIDNTEHFIDKIIKQKRNEIKQQKDFDLLQLDDDKKFRSTLDVLLNLLNSENGITDEELRDEVTTIVMAGSDTTAISLGFILVMLGMHPEHQERVYEEVLDVLGADGTLHHEDLKRLPYTERVIKESLRVFPPGPLIGRNVEEDIRLESCTVPAGCTFVGLIIGMHRDATLYPDPLKFDPDRFLPEEIAKRHPYSYIPFAAGPRNCIGMTYAMMHLKTTVAYLVRKYKFMTEYKSIETLEIRADLLMKPVRGHLISIEMRN